MGGSKSYSINDVVRGKKISGSAGSTSAMVAAVESGVADQIVSQTLSAVISYEPSINTLLLAVEVLKIAYEMYVAGEKEYQRTGDQDQAVLAAAKKGAGIVVDKLKEQALRIAVSKGWDQIKTEQNIRSSPEIDTLIVDSVTSKLEELLQ